MNIKDSKLAILAASILASVIVASPAVSQDADVPTYLLANIYVENMDAYMSDYATPLVPLLLEAGGEILVVAPEVNQLEGEYVPNLTVVVRFPSAEAANKFYYSSEYQTLRPSRLANTDTDISTLVLAPEFAVPSQ